MARLTLILGVLATVVYLLDGFRFMLNEWRNWRNKGKWVVVLGLCLTPGMAEAACSGAGQTWSCPAGSTPADVQAAHDSATNGYTITLASGAYTWATGVSFTTPGTLQGAGSGATIITSTAALAIEIVPSSDAFLTRITDIGFELGTFNNGRVAIQVKGKPYSASIPTNLRIDHNAFSHGGGSPGVVVIIAKTYALIDHNTFTNCYNAVFGWGLNVDTVAWADAYTAGDIFPGTANATFVEQNTFTITGNAITSDAQVYIQEGSSFVVRYNTFDASAVTNASTVELMYNHHGNQSYCTTDPCTGFRGQPLFESYNNVGLCAASGNCEFLSLRGGSSLIHDETFTRNGSTGATLKVSEEECWQGAFFSPLRTLWPAQDQIMNTFFWNITLDGTPVTDVTIEADNFSCTGTFVQENRDYWFHAPESTGGKESFTGTRFGGSTTAPTTGDVGSMTFSGTGANAYYPYAPYTYPHPLQGITTSTTSPAVIARVLRWMSWAGAVSATTWFGVAEGLSLTLGLGFHFRRPLTRLAFAGIQAGGTLFRSAPPLLMHAKQGGRDVALKALTVFNHITKPRR